MGIFYDTATVVNRAPIDITVTFDGQQITLKPGLSILPKVAISHGKNQNPIMGTADPNNPHMSGGQYLLGVVNDIEYPDDPCEPLTDEEWATHLGKPCRVNEQMAFEERYGSDPKAKMVIHGKGKKSTANTRQETASSAGPVFGREASQ